MLSFILCCIRTHSYLIPLHHVTLYKKCFPKIINERVNNSSSASTHPFLISSRHQQYECKWYIPLADLTFQILDDSDSCHSVQVLPEHEIEEMKIKISALKSEIQKEKVHLVLEMFDEHGLTLTGSRTLTGSAN